MVKLPVVEDRKMDAELLAERFQACAVPVGVAVNCVTANRGEVMLVPALMILVTIAPSPLIVVVLEPA